jgi:hypothetical protein
MLASLTNHAKEYEKEEPNAIFGLSIDLNFITVKS